MYCSGFVALRHINLRGLFNAKTIFVEEQQRYYLIRSLWDKGVHAFPKGIKSKVNVIVRLNFEVSYFESAVQHFNHCVTGTKGRIVGYIHFLLVLVSCKIPTASFINCSYQYWYFYFEKT